MDRLVQRNVLATSGRAVEAAGDVDTLLLDKTGTITFGNRQATELIPAAGVPDAELAAAARLSSLADQTPEGRSIVTLCAGQYGLPPEATAEEAVAEFVPFTAQTRMSGVDIGGREIRKGADRLADGLGGSDIERAAPRSSTGSRPTRAAPRSRSRCGSTPRPGCSASSGSEGRRQAGHARARFAELRAMGIRTVMVTGDNPLTARAIAAEAGVDDHPRRGDPRGQDEP